MIELKEWDYNLLKRIEKANSTNYRIVEINDMYYIRPEDLFTCLDEVQEYREYAETHLIEVSEEASEKFNEYIPTLDKTYIDEINSLKEELEGLKEENEILRDKALMVCNEDDIDRLNFEGVML